MKNLILLTLVLLSANLFALEVTKIDSLNFGTVNALSSRKKRIPPSQGARVFVHGIPGRTVEAQVDNNIILNSNGIKFKIEKANFEKSKIVLDKVGKGVFRLGAIISIIEIKESGDISEDIWVNIKYDN